MDVRDEHVKCSKGFEDDAPPSKKAKKGSKPADTPSQEDKLVHFCEQIRGATGWHDTMSKGTWKNCTTDKSRRTLFVLQAPGGGDQFCCVGKVFNARLSRQELDMPLPYDSPPEHTELHVSLSLRNSGDNPYWTEFSKDMESQVTTFGSLRTKAIDDAFVPLFADKPDTVKGIPDSRLKRGFGKTKKDIAASLESMWGGTGLGGDGDIVRLKRKCYNTNSSETSSEDFMEKWLSVVDERGDPVNYLDTPDSIRTGDTVLVWYRVLAQACAGNFHLSLEARQVMRLGRGSDSTAGSAGLAAALAAAMERNDDI